MFQSQSLEKMQIMLLTDLDVNVMMDLLSGSSVYTQHVEQNAIKTAKSIENDQALTEDQEQIQLELLSDDIDYAQEAQELAEELAIIGLYKTIEIRIAKAAKASKLFSNNKIKELYITDKLIEHFNTVGIDVKSILHFNKFQELKQLNNCLKHSGEVNQALADLDPSKWVKGKKITDFATHFHGLLEPNMMFLNNLGADLRSKL